jgi:hypothetical protein
MLQFPALQSAVATAFRIPFNLKMTAFRPHSASVFRIIFERSSD